MEPDYWDKNRAGDVDVSPLVDFRIEAARFDSYGSAEPRLLLRLELLGVNTQASLEIHQAEKLVYRIQEKLALLETYRP